MPTVDRILETALYFDDLSLGRAFYSDLFHFPIYFADHRLCAMDVAGRSVLLLFQRGASLQPTTFDGGTVPAHDGAGPLHLAFAIGVEEYEPWKRELAARGIAMESEVTWPQGARSLYFRDCGNHVVELVTPGLWGTD